MNAELKKMTPAQVEKATLKAFNSLLSFKGQISDIAARAAISGDPRARTLQDASDFLNIALARLNSAANNTRFCKSCNAGLEQYGIGEPDSQECTSCGRIN